MAVAAPPPVRALRPPRAVREFLSTEVAGGVVLAIATVAALGWANSPWQEGYESFWHQDLVVRVGRFSVAEDLRHWVNDGLMALFFFVVGVEIKQELVAGELRHFRAAALPAAAALGGMVVPALLYFALNAGGPGARGWGIPMATDIAFALGVLALLGRFVPPPLRLFLLTLAIVDDIGAIVVIAVFYSSGIDWRWLGAAVALLGVIVVLRRLRVLWPPAYVLLGLGVWFATFESGVHATIAGVVLGLLVLARPLAPTGFALRWVEHLDEAPENPSNLTPEAARQTARAVRAVVPATERVAHDLHPWSSFFIVPLFALANAGVRLEAGVLDRPGATAVAAGVAVGLVLGKGLGIAGLTWVAVRLGLAPLPEGAGWRQILGIAWVAGIGFTVSLFVAGLAFADADLVAAAKLGILAGSATAALVGAALLRFGGDAARGRPPIPIP